LQRFPDPLADLGPGVETPGKGKKVRKNKKREVKAGEGRGGEGRRKWQDECCF